MITTTHHQRGGRESVTHRRVIAAPASAVFALFTDPQEHARIDGIGAVRGVVDAPARLVAGSVFRMQMSGYRTTNTVVEYEPDVLIAWRHRGRHVWRWQLRAVEDGTEVTGTFDYSAKRLPTVVQALGFPRRAGAAVAGTLDALHRRFA